MQRRDAESRVMGAALTDNAQRVLEARYLRQDEQRRVIETPDQLFRRVARAIAQAELYQGGVDSVGRWEREFLNILANLEFLPNSPTLMNAGASRGQLSACFVLPVKDSMEEIFESLKQMALVQRTGGGTGFSFSRLRPAGDLVASTSGIASGPVSFMKIFDAATEHIRQGGKRRGANMGVLRVDHPDVMEFIHAKLDGRSLQNFNISVAATDVFLGAVRDDGEYELVHPRTGSPVRRLRARPVFDAISEAAWRTGDPGLLFIDAINRTNPTPQIGTIEATNPCGEVPLLPWEACNLGSINLSRMLRQTPEGAIIDWAKLQRTTHVSMRFLDNVIEVNHYPSAESDRMVKGNRKVGLGVMGFAEMLADLDVSYLSERAVEIAEDVMRFIDVAAMEASQALAEERGLFPWWPGSAYEAQGLRVRNATRTAIAPTGTIGIIAGTSPSIEPIFALAYRRHALDGQVLTDVNPLFLRHAELMGLDAWRLVGEVAKHNGIRHMPGVPDELRRRFVTALEVPWQQHLAIQAAFQRHVDNSVSKTINMPHDATAEDIRQAYWHAWELGLKGITVYRYGSKDKQVLELGADEEPAEYEYTAKCDPEECRV